MKRKHVQKSLCGLLWLFLWQGAVMLVHNSLLLPGPLDTFRALWRLAGTGEFYVDIGMTLLRITGGFACAVLTGTALGFLCHFSSLADAFLSPARTVIRSTPVASFIVLLWLWFTKGMVPALVSFLMVVPVVWTGVQEGLKSTDPLLIEMARAYRLHRVQKLKDIYFPSVRTHFSAAVFTGMGFAWKSGISAEVIAVPLRAIGSGIHDAKIYLNTDELFAWTSVVIIMSVLLEMCLRRLMKREKGK